MLCTTVRVAKAIDEPEGQHPRARVCHVHRVVATHQPGRQEQSHVHRSKLDIVLVRPLSLPERRARGGGGAIVRVSERKGCAGVRVCGLLQLAVGFVTCMYLATASSSSFLALISESLG